MPKRQYSTKMSRTNTDQRAMSPRPVGSGQRERISSHEGSQLGKPQTAKVHKGGKII